MDTYKKLMSLAFGMCGLYLGHQSWIFKSFRDAAATTDATTSAANKIWIFKSFSRNTLGNTKGSLALLNDCCQRWVFPRPPMKTLFKDRYFVSYSAWHRKLI